MIEIKGRHVLLGVTGSIAAYKSPDIVRRLREHGYEVRVVMTASAEKLVSPTVFQAVSGEPVRGDLWDHQAEAAMGHIELARWADHVLIAPASAQHHRRACCWLSCKSSDYDLSGYRSQDYARTGYESGHVG